MTTISDFDTLINQAAHAMAGSLKTSIKFIDTDGSHHDVRKYVGNRYHPISAEQGPVRFGAESQSDNSDVVQELHFNNTGDSSGHMGHVFSKSFTDTLSVSLTAGISSTITAKFDASVGLPEDIAKLGGGVEESVTVSLDATVGVDTSKTVEISTEASYDVPPHTYATLTWSIEERNFTVPFTAEVTVNGQVAIWFEHKREIQPNGGNHYLWFIPVQVLLSHLPQWPQGYTPMGGSVRFTAEGVMQAKIGTAGTVETTTRPANPALPAGLVTAGPVMRMPDAPQAVAADDIGEAA